uniref:F-box domain-containing protein n=1 Tax=Steinernema glaseri TaxID=37863 RepID=A0A1I7YGC5_9BILA
MARHRDRNKEKRSSHKSKGVRKHRHRHGNKNKDKTPRPRNDVDEPNEEQEVYVGTAEFNDLPTHLKLMIFEYLDPKSRVMMERVSQSWQAILKRTYSTIMEADIPSSITKFFDLEAITDLHVCGFLAKCGPYLRKLEFFIPSKDVGLHVFHSVAQRCGNLKELRLVSDVESEELSELLCIYVTFGENLLKRLEAFHLTQSKMTPITSFALKGLSRVLTNVRTFKLEVGALPDDPTSFFPNSADLKTLSIFMLMGEEDEGRVCMPPQYIYRFFTYLAEFYESLKNLEINLCYDLVLDEEVMYDLFVKMCQKNVKLEKMNFGMRTPEMDAKSLWFGKRAYEAFKHFKDLEVMSLSACHLPSQLHKSLPTNLKSLSLTAVQVMNHREMLEIAQVLPHLESITLGSAHWYVECPPVKMETVVEILKISKKLLVLELNPFYGIDIDKLIRYLNDDVHNVLASSKKILPDQLRIRLMCCEDPEELEEDIVSTLNCRCSGVENDGENVFITVNRVCQRFRMRKSRRSKKYRYGI